MKKHEQHKERFFDIEDISLEDLKTYDDKVSYLCAWLNTKSNVRIKDKRKSYYFYLKEIKRPLRYSLQHKPFDSETELPVFTTTSKGGIWIYDGNSWGYQGQTLKQEEKRINKILTYIKNQQ